MSRLPLLALPALFLLPACDPQHDEAEAEDGLAARVSLHPDVGGLGTTLNVTLDATQSTFRFGETDLDLGPGIHVASVTVQDAYTAIAQVQIDPDAELGVRDATVYVQDRSFELTDAFRVIAESFTIEPDSGLMGSTVDLTILGTSTEWQEGYTWTNLGDGIRVLEFRVLSNNIAQASVAIRPDARPGPRDVHMQDGPHVVTLYDGFMVDRASIAATFDPPEAWQGDTVDFTIVGADTAFTATTAIEFWDDSGRNNDIQVTSLTVLDGENLYGRMRLSNASRLGWRDVLIRYGDEAVLVPDAFEVFDAPPDLSRVWVFTTFDVLRQIDNATGALGENVRAFAYFIIPLDPPCGAASPPGDGPMPYDVNGVFPVPPPPEPVDCPAPETVDAGDFVWYDSPENSVPLHRYVIPSTGQIVYIGRDLVLDDYRFNQLYDLRTQGVPHGIPEVTIPDVQPTVPADYYLLSPSFWGDFTQPRAEDFTYTWTPAQTYPDAFFITQISGTLVATGEGGFAGSIPWDDGQHTYRAHEISQLEPGPVSFAAVSYIEGPPFGLPGSIYQNAQSTSVVQTTAHMVLE